MLRTLAARLDGVAGLAYYVYIESTYETILLCVMTQVRILLQPFLIFEEVVYEWIYDLFGVYA